MFDVQVYNFINFLHLRCAACSKCFLTSNKLKYHIRRTHLPVDGLFECTNCDKECKTLRLLLNHQKSHIRVYCPHCKKLVSVANYDHHVRTAHAVRVGKKRRATDKGDTVTSKKQKDNQNKNVASGSKTPNKRSTLPPPTSSNVRVRNLECFQELSVHI